MIDKIFNLRILKIKRENESFTSRYTRWIVNCPNLLYMEIAEREDVKFTSAAPSSAEVFFKSI